jgi:hypothetical protein
VKDIASLTGRLIQQTGPKPTGSQHGETGYAARPPRSYGLDHEPTAPPAPVPAVARTPRRNMPQTSVFSMPSQSLELRQVTLGMTQDGGRITAMVLARRSDLSLLKSLIATVREELAPPGPEQISAELARLFSHYPQQQSGNNMTVAADWMDDLGTVSAKAFAEACRQWRRGTNAFKPSPGQLLALIEKIEAPYRDRLEALEEMEIETERMPPRERLNHLHQWLYELELGMVPFDVHQKGHDEIQRYLASETALVKAEIQQLEAMGT